MTLTDRKTMIQFIKYSMVGVMNTLITLIVIYVCKSLLGVNEYFSNTIGYIAGLINSFLWNRNWVFKVKEDSLNQIIRFAAGFLLCYGLQFLVVWVLNEHTFLGSMEWTVQGFTFGGYGVATIVGMVVYTLANFVYNRLITFRV